jgi:hypothetical protein
VLLKALAQGLEEEEILEETPGGQMSTSEREEE